MSARGYSKFAADGLLKPTLGALRSSRAPRIATGILAVGLAAGSLGDGVALYHAVTAAGDADADSARTSNVTRGGAFSSDSLRALMSAHLFGLGPSPVRAGNATAPRDTSLVLTGTIATANPSRGIALIGTSKDQALAHAVGEAVTSGVILRAVYPNRVIVERAGLLVTVFLPRGVNASGPGQMSGRASADEPDEGTSGAQPDIAGTLAQESNRTAAFLRQEPFYSQGRLRGILIEPGADPGFLAQLGLRAGDVLQHVDGAVVAQPDRLDMLRERLAAGGPVTVSVIRPGVGPVDVTIDGSLVAAMIEN